MPLIVTGNSPCAQMAAGNFPHAQMAATITGSLQNLTATSSGKHCG